MFSNLISCVFPQVKDMQTKLDEAEQLAVQGGRKVTSRLEQKIKVSLSFTFLVRRDMFPRLVAGS